MEIMHVLFHLVVLQETGILFDAFSNMGFTLNNGMRIMGPCAAFARSVLHWDVSPSRVLFVSDSWCSFGCALALDSWGGLCEQWA